MKSYGVTTQMKATEQYFPVVLFIMLYKVVLILTLWTKSCGVTIHMKATTSLWLNTPTFRPSYSMLANNRTITLTNTLSFLQRWARGRRKEGKKRLKVVAFPTLVTISSDFSMMSNMLF